MRKPHRQGQGQPFGALVEALGGVFEQTFRFRQPARQPCHSLAAVFEPPPHGRHHTPRAVQHPGHKLGAHRHRHFGGGRGGRSAHIGGMVHEGNVGLVPHRRDQGNGASRRRAHRGFLVEGHEILEAATAPRDNEKVGPGHFAAGRNGVEPGNGRSHLRRRCFTLYRHRPQQHAARETVGEAVQDIADDRARGRSDDTDDHGQEGQVLLAHLVE